MQAASRPIAQNLTSRLPLGIEFLKDLHGSGQVRMVLEYEWDIVFAEQIEKPRLEPILLSDVYGESIRRFCDLQGICR